MSFKIVTLQEDQEPAWDNYVNEIGGSIYHLSKWRKVIKKVFNHDSIYLQALDEQGKIQGILPLVRIKSLLFGDYIVSLPYFNYGGVLANNNEVGKALLDEAEKVRKELGSSHVELRHIDEFASGLPERTDKVTMLLNLPEESDDLWKAIGSKRRAQVKRPIREGAEFKLGGVELLEDFYQVFSTNMRDLGTPVYSKAFFREILNTFPTQSYIGIVYLKDIPVGAAFLLKHFDGMEIPWASTLREYNRFGINMFMYWNILKNAIEDKCKVFDFGRSSKDSGTLKFKKQWGAEPKQLFWYYCLQDGMDVPVMNHSNKKYEMAINLWKKMPLSLTNRIGPHIVKNLP